jgi:hypothetical protein
MTGRGRSASEARQRRRGAGGSGHGEAPVTDTATNPPSEADLTPSSQLTPVRSNGRSPWSITLTVASAVVGLARAAFGLDFPQEGLDEEPESKREVCITRLLDKVIAMWEKALNEGDLPKAKRIHANVGGLKAYLASLRE